MERLSWSKGFLVSKGIRKIDDKQPANLSKVSQTVHLAVNFAKPKGYEKPVEVQG